MGRHADMHSSRCWPDRLVPSVSDVVFVIVLATVLIGGRSRLLNDPGTFWHARLGDMVLAERAVPRSDALTFTRLGETWVDQSWLFDVLLVSVVRLGGWSAAALMAALLLSWLYSAVARALVRDGRSGAAALAASMLAVGVGANHFLVRPHLFTLVFFWATLRLCQLQHERGGRWLAWTVPLTALWANLHGGFLAGPLVVLSAGVGHAISGPWDRDRKRRVGLFTAAGAFGTVAGLVNPYGVGLYRHIHGLLWSGRVTELIDEYRPLTSAAGVLPIAECLIVGLVALPSFGRARLTRYELVHVLVWLHLGLASVRNAPLLALAAAPGLSRLIDGALTPSGGLAWPERRSVWPALATLGLLLGSCLGVSYARHDPARWPLSALPTVDALPPERRLFHELDWGGLVEFQCDPARLAYIDDRFELFGRGEVLRYLNALEGGPDWERIRDRDSIGLVWVRPDRPLARRLADDPAWGLRHRDETSVLFERQGPDLSEPAVAGR